MHRRPGETVAGVIAAAAIAAGFLELAYRPFRVAPAAAIVVLVAAAMSREQQRLVGIAVAVVSICFVVGATLAIITHHPLY
jgi:hypothetical protein